MSQDHARQGGSGGGGGDAGQPWSGSDAAADPTSLPDLRGGAGTYFLGRYRVVDEIGIGGMASVHLGRMDGPGGFQKWVAIKRIHPHLIEDDTFIHMFLDEARVAARISHPNVATVFELGKHEDTYWIAMEYLHGEPLREVMRRCEEIGQPMPPEIACRVIADAAEGLHAAHELLGKNGEKLGLVHRDVTPHNLFVTYDGTTKVVDFGIAKFQSRMSNTRAGTLKGKLAYMSPEQVHGEGIDRRTDIFALGVVLWELTTGQRLFRMDNDLDTLAKVQECNVPRPSSIIRGYPLDLEKIVLKALARNRAERFKTAREFSRALQALLMRRGLFIASDEVAAYVTSIFQDRIARREAHLRWAADVTQTINLDTLQGQLPPAGEASLVTFNSEVQPQTGKIQAPRPAAGMPPEAPRASAPPRPASAIPPAAGRPPQAPPPPRPSGPPRPTTRPPPAPAITSRRPPPMPDDPHPANDEGPTIQGASIQADGDGYGDEIPTMQGANAALSGAAVGPGRAGAAPSTPVGAELQQTWRMPSRPPWEEGAQPEITPYDEDDDDEGDGDDTIVSVVPTGDRDRDRDRDPSRVSTIPPRASAPPGFPSAPPPGPAGTAHPPRPAAGRPADAQAQGLASFVPARPAPSRAPTPSPLPAVVIAPSVHGSALGPSRPPPPPPRSSARPPLPDPSRPSADATPGPVDPWGAPSFGAPVPPGADPQQTMPPTNRAAYAGSYGAAAGYASPADPWAAAQRASQPFAPAGYDPPGFPPAYDYPSQNQPYLYGTDGTARRRRPSILVVGVISGVTALVAVAILIAVFSSTRDHAPATPPGVGAAHPGPFSGARSDFASAIGATSGPRSDATPPAPNVTAANTAPPASAASVPATTAARAADPGDAPRVTPPRTVAFVPTATVGAAPRRDAPRSDKGYLRVFCTPDCQVSDNGRALGASPVWNEMVTVGEHRVRLTRASPPVTKVVSVIVTAGETASITQKMDP